MRKYIIGAIFGFLVATAVGARAEGVKSLIGEVIDGAFNVKVDGKELADQAVVIQGTSYLPVRAIGEATGYDVAFDPNAGIELTKKADEVAEQPAEQNPNIVRAQRIEELRAKSEEIKKEITGLYQTVRKYMSLEMTDPQSIDQNDYQAAKKAWEAKKEELAAVNKEIAELTGRPVQD
ncbi:hypothetical protein ABE504_25150 [Paenibacillus oryzisoli]|uniref:stalk domain-containing protein n=1 Tax=Paenibacillus oryzisoli TaxID=1850517 RepID=UPI003D2B23C9